PRGRALGRRQRRPAPHTGTSRAIAVRRLARGAVRGMAFGGRRHLPGHRRLRRRHRRRAGPLPRRGRARGHRRLARASLLAPRRARQRVGAAQSREPRLRAVAAVQRVPARAPLARRRRARRQRTMTAWWRAWVLFVVLSVAPTVSAAEPLTVQDVLASVDATHPDLEIAERGVEAAAGRSFGARGGFDPVLSIRGRWNP